MNIRNHANYTNYSNPAFKGGMKDLERLTEKVIKAPSNFTPFFDEVTYFSTVPKNEAIEYLNKKLEELGKKSGFGIKAAKEIIQEGIELFSKK